MAKYSGKHMAGGARKPAELLRDNYTYQEPRQHFQDVSSYSSARRKQADQRELERQRAPVKKKHTAVKVVIALVIVLAAAVGAGIFYIQGYLLKDLTVKPITKDKEQLGINSQLVVNADTSIKNIALLGLDSRNSDHSDNSRSDVVMIITVDNKHGKIKMTSVLRDSNVSIRGQDEDGSSYYFDDKITHTYRYGGEELVVQTLNRNFYLNIEDYVTVDFNQTAAIVDSVGGVDIQLTGAEIQQMNSNLFNLYMDVQNKIEEDQANGTFEQNIYAAITRDDFMDNIYGEKNLYSSADEYEDGVYHLNGNQAVAYARIRYLEGGDNVRASRQQTVLKAMLNKVRGKSKLEYPELIRKIMPMCTTSLEFDDIVSMIPILMTDFTIETMSVPGEEDHADGGYNSMGGWVYLYDLEQAAREINEFIYETPTEVQVDDDVIRVSNIYRNNEYESTQGEIVEDEDEKWTPPEDFPWSEQSGGEESGEESETPASSEEGGEGEGEGEGSQEPTGGGEDEPPYEEPSSQEEGGGDEPESSRDEDDWMYVGGNGDVTN